MVRASDKAVGKAHLKKESRALDSSTSRSDALLLNSELKVHQVELEQQNEELLQARAELEAERARYAGLYDFAPVGYLTLDREGIIRKVNLSGTKLLGGRRAEQLDRPLESYVCSSGRQTWQDFITKVFTRDHATCEVSLEREYGPNLSVRLEGGLSEDGQTCLAIMTDITEQKALLEIQDFLLNCGWSPGSLNCLQALARYLAQTLAMDFVCIDRLEDDELTASTVAVYFDGHFEDNISYALKDTPCGEVVGQAVCCFPERVRHLFPKDEVLQTMKAESYVGTTLWGKDGRPIGLIAVIGRKPLANPQLAGSLLRLAGIRVAGELEREQAEAALMEAKEQADAANRAKSDFLARMSHEIRTPLNAVIGLTELTLQTTLKGEQRDYLETVRDSGQHLLMVINDILDISKIEARKLQLEHRDFDLRQSLSTTFRTLSVPAAEKGLSLALDIAPEVPRYMKGDLGRLRQILFNLVGNAIKFTASGGITANIRLENACPPDDKVPLLFTVADTGQGIPADKLPTIFDSFTQVDASIARRFGGSGLGLAICRELVRMMGGDIQVSSEAGKGTVFTFTAWLALGDPAAVESEPTPEDLKQQTALGSLNILLVEDNPINVKVAHAALTQRGHALWVSQDGASALRQLAAGTFDLVLMDLEMPGMDGLEATARIRAGEAGPHNANIPIIAMTAHAISGFREKSIAAGMNDYLSKPLDFREMESILHRVMVGARHASALVRDVLPEGQVLNTDAALSRFDGDRNLLLEVQKGFLAEMPHKFTLAKQSLAAGDAPSLSLQLHSLKNLAGLVGAEYCLERVSPLEAAARKGDLTTVSNGMAGLEDAFAQARDALVVDMGLMEQAAANADKRRLERLPLSNCHLVMREPGLAGSHPLNVASACVIAFQPSGGRFSRGQLLSVGSARGHTLVVVKTPIEGVRLNT